MSPRRSRRHLLGAGVCVATMAGLWGVPARAQSPDNVRKLSAEALFDQSLRLIEAGDHSAACPKLAESQRLDPGIGTLLYLADCYRSLGKTASAWVTFREAEFRARQSGDTEREATATSHAEALRGSLTLLSLDFDAPPPELDIELDGHPISPELIGVPFPIDPGRHSLDVTAPGYKPWRSGVDIEAKPGIQTFQIPVLSRLPPQPKPARPETTLPAKSNWAGVGWIAVGAGLGALVGAGALYSTNPDSTLGPVIFASAGALTAGAGVVVLVSSDPAPDRSTRSGTASFAPLVAYRTTF